MKFNFRNIFFICWFFLIAGCSIFDSNFERISGNYYVGWVDDQKARSISYNEGNNLYSLVIPSCVEVISWDDRFIVAQNYVQDKDGGKNQYYIVDMNVNQKNANQKEGVWGPYSIDELQVVRKKNGVPEQLILSKRFNGCR